MEYNILTLTFCVSVIAICVQGSGELNDRCRTIHECRDFGYICARNKTCQCARPIYIPNSSGDKCVGTIDRKCKYDSHCIEGAFCMNQYTCKCKEGFYPSGDGLTCSNSPIDRKCKYDEHCVEGAFCMNQSNCKCKEGFYPDEDGLTCSSTRSNILGSTGHVVLPCLIFYFLNLYL